MSDASREVEKVVKTTDPNPHLPESELWQGDYSGKAMFGSWMMAAFLSLATLLVIIMFFRTTPTAWWSGLVIIAGGWFVLFLKFAYHKLVHHYELTTQRLRHREGILIRTMNRIELVDIDDIVYKQGPIQRILDVGNITIKSRDTTHPVLVMYGIPEIRKVADLIDNARLTERRRRSVRFESL